MPTNIFGEEDPETVEANKRAQDLLKRFTNSIEELHSRHGDGFNRFGSEETGVVRLLLIFDELLNNETYDGNGWAFISTAVNTVEKVSPIVQRPLAQVLERRVPSDLESSRLWIIYCLDVVDCMYQSLKAMWDLSEVVDAFYKRSSAIFASKIDFKTEFLKLVKVLHHPHGGGGNMEFNLDIGALSCYNTIFRSQVLKKEQQQQQQHYDTASTRSSYGTGVAGGGGNDTPRTVSGVENTTGSTRTSGLSPRPNYQHQDTSHDQQQYHTPSYNPVTSGNNAATPNTSSNNYDLAGPLTKQPSTNNAGAGGKKVIRRIVKKKGGGSETVTTTMVGGYQQNNNNNQSHMQDQHHSSAMLMDDSSYPVEPQVTQQFTTPVPSHHQQHSSPAPTTTLQKKSVAQVETKDSQTSSSFFKRADKTVQVDSQLANKNDSNTTASSGATSSSPGSPSIGSSNKKNIDNNNNKRSLEELHDLDLALSERERTLQEDERQLSEMQEKIEKQQQEVNLKNEDLSEKLEKATLVAEELKKLYVGLFNQTDSGATKVSESSIDQKIPLLIKVLKGEKLLVTGNNNASSSSSSSHFVCSVCQQTEEDAKNNNNNSKNNTKETTSTTTPSVSASTSAAASPSMARAGSFTSRRPTLPTVSNVSTTDFNNNKSSTTPTTSNAPPPTNNASFSGSRPRAQTTVVKQQHVDANNNNNNNTSKDDSTSTTITNRPAASLSLPPTYGNKQTPESSYNASPANSPAPRTTSASEKAQPIQQNDSQNSNNNETTANRALRSVSELSSGGQQSQQHFNNNTSFASASAVNKTMNSNANSKGIVTVAPDTCTTRPSQGIPYLIDAFEESERNAQLKKQNNRCPKCQTDLIRNEASNPLLRSIVNMGQLAMAQKPRRCHYSGEIFCQKCHTNKTALVPHKVCGEWDFEEFHVSDSWYDYLGNNFERPIIHLPDVPLVARKPVAQQLAQFRRKLNRMHAVLVLCPTIQKQSRSVFTTSYYFAREHWWSLADFVRMRLLENDAPSSLSRGVPNADLLQHLGRLMSEALDHINSCPSCREKGYGVCTLCHSGSAAAAEEERKQKLLQQQKEAGDENNYDDESPPNFLSEKVAFWEDGVACDECGSIYHASCYELRGCPKCSK